MSFDTSAFVLKLFEVFVGDMERTGGEVNRGMKSGRGLVFGFCVIDGLTSI